MVVLLVLLNPFNVDTDYGDECVAVNITAGNEP